jgi:hypothetical protein
MVLPLVWARSSIDACSRWLAGNYLMITRLAFPSPVTLRFLALSNLSCYRIASRCAYFCPIDEVLDAEILLVSQVLAPLMSEGPCSGANFWFKSTQVPGPKF